MTPEEIERWEFKTSRKGADTGEVQRFLRRVADEMRQLAARPPDPISELSNEVGSVLKSAHDSAALISDKAQADAAEVAAAAEIEASRLRAEAELVRDEALAEAERLRAEATAEAERLRAEAIADADQIRIGAVAEGDVITAQAQGRVAEIDEKLAEAERVSNDAAEAAAKKLADAEIESTDAVATAEQRAAEIIEAAEGAAQQRAGEVIARTQLRLDQLLASERDVHDRLQLALGDVRSAIERVAGKQADDLELTVIELEPATTEDSVWPETDRADQTQDGVETVVGDTVDLRTTT